MTNDSGRTPDAREERGPFPSSVTVLNPITSGARHAKRGLTQLLAALPPGDPDRMPLLHALAVARRLVAASGRT